MEIYHHAQHHGFYHKPVFKNRVYSWYPILVILYGLLKLVESVLVINPAKWETYAYYFVHISMIWLLFNLVLLIHFIMLGFEQISYVMPIYYVVDYLLSMALGFSLAAFYGFQSLAGQSWFIVLTAIFVIFEIGFAFYLLFRRL